MEKIALAVCALLAFLLPIGFYCLILAAINRRSRPLLVSGIWDTIGVLFAMSGFFLVTMPMLLSEFVTRVFGVEGNALDTWLEHWILFIAYLLLIIGASVFVVLWRSRKTMIYNVDAEQFTTAMERTLTDVGLTARVTKARLVLSPAIAEGSGLGFERPQNAAGIPVEPSGIAIEPAALRKR